MLAFVWATSLSFSLVPVASLPMLSLVVSQAEAPASPAGTREERAVDAAGYYAQGDYVPAALAFEALMRDYPQDKKFVFNASASRYGAGHYAHAVALIRAYLELPGLTDEDRQDAETQLREAASHVAPVLVSVALASGGSGQIALVIRYVPGESGEARPDLSFPARPDGSTKIELDPGDWLIRAEGDGYAPSEVRLEVSKGDRHTLTLQVALAPKAVAKLHGVEPGDVGSPAKDVPSKTSRRATLGLAISGGVVAVAGIGMMGAGGAGVREAETCDAASATQCLLDMAGGLRTRGIGSMVFGAGAGLLTGGMTWLIREPRKRQVAWIVEAAVGGVSLIAGMVLVPLATRGFNNDSNVNTIGDWGSFYAEHKASAGNAVGAALVGFGAGALISASTGLALQRRHSSRVQVGGMAGRGQFGLTLSGRF